MIYILQAMMLALEALHAFSSLPSERILRVELVDRLQGLRLPNLNFGNSDERSPDHALSAENIGPNDDNFDKDIMPRGRLSEKHYWTNCVVRMRGYGPQHCGLREFSVKFVAPRRAQCSDASPFDENFRCRTLAAVLDRDGQTGQVVDRVLHRLGPGQIARLDRQVRADRSLGGERLPVGLSDGATRVERRQDRGERSDEAEAERPVTYPNLLAGGIRRLPLSAKIAVAILLALGAPAIGGWGLVRAWNRSEDWTGADDGRALLILGAHVCAGLGLLAAFIWWGSLTGLG